MPVPNIVYIHSHDTGRYVQPYGHAIPTPHIQQLAEEGVLFRQAFCANPTCSPSRACLLTGQWAHSCGMTGLVNRGWTLPYPRTAADPYPAKSRIHHGHGRLPARGSGHRRRRLHPPVAPRGSRYPNRGPSRRLLSRRSSRALLFRTWVLAKLIARDAVLRPSPKTRLPPIRATCDQSAPFPDTPETRRDMAEYIDAARTLDAKMGRVFAALQDNGLADNTLVICTTDHGIAFPTMKCNLTDHGIGVMLVLRGPGGFSNGQVVDALVSQVDIYPTVCALAGIAGRPDHVQGTFAPAAGKRPSPRNPRRNFRRSKLPHLLRTPTLHPHAALQVHPPLRPAPTSSHAQLRRQLDQRLFYRPRLAATPPRARTALRL